MKVRLVVAVILAAFQFPVFAAQSSNLSGSWAVEAPAASGANFQLGAASGTLTLEQKGEVVTGTWKGRMPEPWKLSGHVKGNAFELQTEFRGVPATVNDEPATVQRRWIFSGTVDGDTMTGSMSLAGGDGEAPTQPFSAARRR